VSVVIWTIVVITILGVFGVNLGPLIAGAGIIGIAIGFGAQDLVKDFLSGVFMLLEDQYGVGDIIDAGEAAGVVEGVTLRSTRVRDVTGTLWHIPNGEIRRIGNMSQEWARALLDIGVAYGTDVDVASQLILRVATDMAHEDDYQEVFLDEPEIWGVENLGTDSVDIRLVIKTQPGQQYAIARELRRRIKRAFDTAEVEIPFPQRTVWLRTEQPVALGGADARPSATRCRTSRRSSGRSSRPGAATPAPRAGSTSCSRTSRRTPRRSRAATTPGGAARARRGAEPTGERSPQEVVAVLHLDRAEVVVLGAGRQDLVDGDRQPRDRARGDRAATTGQGRRVVVPVRPDGVHLDPFRVEVDEPVLRHPEALVQPSLAEQVVAPGRRRRHLDDQVRRPLHDPRAVPIRRGDEQQVGLERGVVGQPHAERGDERLTAVGACVVVEGPEQLTTARWWSRLGLGLTTISPSTSSQRWSSGSSNHWSTDSRVHRPSIPRRYGPRAYVGDRTCQGCGRRVAVRPAGARRARTSLHRPSSLDACGWTVCVLACHACASIACWPAW
jgi:hypothetical protein